MTIKQMVVKPNVLACLRQYKIVERETDNAVLERILGHVQKLDKKVPGDFTSDEVLLYVHPRKKNIGIDEIAEEVAQ